MHAGWCRRCFRELLAQKPVEVSSGESRGEGEEEVDSEKTLEEVGETSP